MATLDQRIKAALSQEPGVIRVDAGETGIDIKVASIKGIDGAAEDRDIAALTRATVQSPMPIHSERTPEPV